MVSLQHSTKLVVFPGGGSPDNSLYSEVYNLISIEAPKYGYTEVDKSLKWPGHISDNGESSGVLTFDGAVKLAKSKLVEMENRKDRYTLLGRSFGTYVACYCAITLDLKGLEKIILWGPPPYWILWEKFQKNLARDTDKYIRKGLQIDETFLKSVIPIETLLPYVKCPTILAMGTEDKYCDADFQEYLRKLSAGNKNIDYRLVNGAIHEITYNSPVWKEYVEKLFT